MMGNRWCKGHGVAWLLVIIGGLNWGLVGAFNFDLVMWLFGGWPMVVRIVYIAVGLAAVALLTAKSCCMRDGAGCKGGSCGTNHKA